MEHLILALAAVVWHDLVGWAGGVHRRGQGEPEAKVESIRAGFGGDVPPILSIGKESVEKQKEADRLKQELAKADSELNSAQARNQEAERALDQYCQDRARVIKDTLRSSGQNPSNNYNKSDFRSQAAQMVGKADAASYCLNDSEREALLV